MYLHNRENFDYSVGCKPIPNKRLNEGAKALLTVGQIVDLLGIEPKAGVTLAFGPYSPRYSCLLAEGEAEGTENYEESEGYESLETALGCQMEGEYGTYIMPEAFENVQCIKVSNSRKRYAIFDEPVTRWPSDILAELQESAVPLEKPLQFEKTRVNSGSIEGKQVILKTEFNGTAQVFPCRNYKTH